MIYFYKMAKNTKINLQTNLKLIFLKPHVIFLILALPFSIISSFTTPALIVADETQHLLRSYEIANGNITPNETTSNRCSFPKNINDFYNDYAKSPTKKTQQQSTSLDSYMNYDETVQQSCGTAAAYSPIMYIPQSTGILFAKLFHTNLRTLVILSRLFSAVFFSFIMYYIIKKVSLGKWVFVAIGLLPISIHYAGSLSADPINNLIAIGFTAFVFNLYKQDPIKISGKQKLLLIILVALLGSTKPQNLALLLLLPFLPKSLFNKNPKKFNSLRLNINKFILGISTLAVAIIANRLSSIMIDTTLNTYSIASNKILSDPIFFLHILWQTYISPFIGGNYNSFIFNGIVSGFSSYSWQLPAIITFLCMATLTATFLYKDKAEQTTKQHLGLIVGSLLSFISTTCLITYAMFTMWAVLPSILGSDATFAAGVQGRYFVSSLILLLPMLLWIGNYIQIRTKTPYIFGLFVFISFLISLTFYTINSLQFLTLY